LKRGPKPKLPSSRGKPILAYPEGLAVCPVCKIGFRAVRVSAIYCSDSCRQRARTARKG
jgi:hypothetical protein